MALGITGAGGFISQPLTVVVIGGLVSSTMLTLVLIPVLYTMAETQREKRSAPPALRPLASERVQGRRGRIFSRRTG